MVPRVQENATEENALDSTHACLEFKKMTPAGFFLRFLNLEKRRTDRILGRILCVPRGKKRIMCVFRKKKAVYRLPRPEEWS